MTPCHYCGAPTANPPLARYYDPVNPTDATFEVCCDRCREPRKAPADYAAPFADDEEGDGG